MANAYRTQRRLKVEELEARYAPAPLILDAKATTAATFTDANGDIVDLRLTGGIGRVEISDAGGNAPSNTDIASINFTSSAASTSLVAAIIGGSGDGRTPAGNIVARNAGGQLLALNNISFPGNLTNLTADQIRLLTLDGDITGTVSLGKFTGGRITAVNINNISVAGPVMGSIVASGHLNGWIQSNGPIFGVFTIAGDVKGGAGIRADGFVRMVAVGGSVSAGATIVAGGELGVLSVGGRLDGNVDVWGVRGIRSITVAGGGLAGTVTARNGDVSVVSLAGDLRGRITAQNNIRMVAMSGDLLGGAGVSANGSIQSLIVGGSNGIQGTVSAGVNLSRLTVNGGLSGAVTAGNGILGYNRIGGNLSGTLASAKGITALIVIGGSLTGAIQAASGSINSVTVQGASLNGAITASNNILSVNVLTGGIGASASITAGGLIGSVSALGVSGNMAAGAVIQAAQSIGRVTLGGSLAGTVQANGPGGLGQVWVGGNLSTGGTVLAGSGHLLQLTVGGNLQGSVSVARLVNVVVTTNLSGTITVAGNLASSQTNAIQIGGSVTAAGRIYVGGTATYGAGLGYNRIRVEGQMNGIIEVGTTIANGAFGDVVIVDASNLSTGQLRGDQASGSATIYTNSPTKLTYRAGATTNTNYLTLFGSNAAPV